MALACGIQISIWKGIEASVAVTLGRDALPSPTWAKPGLSYKVDKWRACMVPPQAVQQRPNWPTNWSVIKDMDDSHPYPPRNETEICWKKMTLEIWVRNDPTPSLVETAVAWTRESCCLSSRGQCFAGLVFVVTAKYPFCSVQGIVLNLQTVLTIREKINLAISRWFELPIYIPTILINFSIKTQTIAKLLVPLESAWKELWFGTLCSKHHQMPRISRETPLRQNGCHSGEMSLMHHGRLKNNKQKFWNLHQI